MNGKKCKYCVIASLLILFIAVTTAFLVNNRSKTNTVNANSVTIPVAMASDNNYVYPTIVSITSILENANKNTKINVYLLHPEDFKNENKEKISALQTKYKNFKIEFMNMGNKFKDAKTDERIPTSSYYRLLLSGLLPDVNKIIWLDGDTITLKDLSEMYKLDMSDYYYRGFLDIMSDVNASGLKDFGIENDQYICAGVMLINLDKLRMDAIEEKFKEFVSKNNEKLRSHDQTVINVTCYGNIGILPPQYGMFNFPDEFTIPYINQLGAKDKYTFEEVKNARENPSILHFGWKPWKDVNVPFSNIWFEYAKKTLYYDEILKKYNLENPL